MKQLLAQKHIGPTTKRYTVAIQCCDPPMPAWVAHTNSEHAARKIYETLRNEEIKGGPGGETCVIWWEHPAPGPTAPTWQYAITDPDDYLSEGYDAPYVYGLGYDQSTVRGQFTYMDNHALQSIAFLDEDHPSRAEHPDLVPFIPLVRSVYTTF